MFKYMKLLPTLFLVISIILSGCGDSSIPYKKGETYRDNNDNFVEIIADNEWKVKGYQNREATYTVKPMEYKAGSYSVISISIKEKFTNEDPLGVRNEEEYHLLSPTENGFSLLVLGTSHPNSKQWKDFKQDFENASDKENFLKQKIEASKWKVKNFKKTN